MKLYYAPGACSLAPHIALREAGVPYELARVDLKKHQVEDGTDYYKVNPKGYVPFLQLDDGGSLTEAAVVLQYIADRKPGTLAPAPGSPERYRLLEWLNFVATELHKGFGPLWDPTTPEETVRRSREKLAKRYEFIDQALAKSPYLTGDKFTIADAYLFVVTNWAGMLKVDLAPYKHVGEFLKRVSTRPAVQGALKEEGLLQKAA